MLEILQILLYFNEIYLHELVFKYIPGILFLSQRKIRRNKNIYFDKSISKIYFSRFNCKETIPISIIIIEK